MRDNRELLVATHDNEKRDMKCIKEGEQMFVE
jgi:hypothetical protein